ncbi:uncharacterized protein B0T15DRAFT_181434 [Chaetomium strumarium]|uniref:Uncharacterized protein n=1 Tax=Chaetomium strumarium TaxID=1170767 RepID=A0AAJ0GWT4_9PEZI|nr:hypothetical protein B0T15DRAFT_181434 [Chaetomium strumarium]
MVVLDAPRCTAHTSGLGPLFHSVTNCNRSSRNAGPEYYWSPHLLLTVNFPTPVIVPQPAPCQDPDIVSTALKDISSTNSAFVAQCWGNPITPTPWPLIVTIVCLLPRGAECTQAACSVSMVPGCRFDQMNTPTDVGTQMAIIERDEAYNYPRPAAYQLSSRYGEVTTQARQVKRQRRDPQVIAINGFTTSSVIYLQSCYLSAVVIPRSNLQRLPIALAEVNVPESCSAQVGGAERLRILQPRAGMIDRLRVATPPTCLMLAAA